MIPPPWAAVVLALGLLRLQRLLAWDTFPPLVRARAWLLGEEVTNRGSLNDRMGLTGSRPEHDVTYRRPQLAELWYCPFCLGFWICLGGYLAWRWEPYWTLTVCAPLALSMAVGLAARWWDP